MCHSRTLNNKISRVQYHTLRIIYKSLLVKENSFTIQEEKTYNTLKKRLSKLLEGGIHLCRANIRFGSELMMNYFSGIFGRQKAISFISSRDHCQRFSPLQISNTSWAESKSGQNLRSDFVEWSCEVVLTTTPQHCW